MKGYGTLADVAAELEKTAAALRSAVREGSGVPEGVPDALRAVLARLEAVQGVPDEAGRLRARVAELEAELARIRGGGGDRDPLGEEAEAMIASGKPPEAYSLRADKGERAEEFLARVYGRFLAKGGEKLFLNDLRKLDEKLVWALAAAFRRQGRALSSAVPTRKEKTDRALAAAGSPDRAAELAKAAAAVEKRRKRSAGGS